MPRAHIAAAIAVTAWLPAVAAADPPASRPLHGSIGVGGYAALGGPADLGAEVVIEVLPGRAFDRYGVRLDVRGLDTDGGGDYLATGGVVFEAAAARPRLALFLHADAGLWQIGDAAGAAVGGGVTTLLAVLGPLALGLDGGATLLVDGTDSELALTSSLTLRVAR